MTTSGTSFAFEFVDLAGTVGPPPFTIIPNPNFADLTPVLVVRNITTPTAPDDFISIGNAAGAPADNWTLEFRWATVGPPSFGQWQLDAFLEGISPFAPNIPLVPTTPPIPPATGFLLSQTEPSVNARAFSVHPITFPPPPPPGVFFLFRLHATLRWDTSAGQIVRVAGHAEGPVITFYQPE